MLSTSRLAGIQAAKRTSDLIPLAHNLNLTKIEIEFSIDDESNTIHCEEFSEMLWVKLELKWKPSLLSLSPY